MDKKRLKQLANGNLHIRDARMADAGHYFCIAANMGDLKEVQVSLRVIGMLLYFKMRFVLSKSRSFCK